VGALSSSSSEPGALLVCACHAPETAALTLAGKEMPTQFTQCVAVHAIDDCRPRRSRSRSSGRTRKCAKRSATPLRPTDGRTGPASFTVDRPIVTSPKNKSEAIEKTSRLAGQRRIDRSNHFTRPNLLARLHIHTARGNDWPVNFELFSTGPRQSCISPRRGTLVFSPRHGLRCSFSERANGPQSMQADHLWWLHVLVRSSRDQTQSDWAAAVLRSSVQTGGSFDKNIGFTFYYRLASNWAAQWSATRVLAGTLRGTRPRRYSHRIGRAGRLQRR
jgi:hypothetical protein